MQTFCGTRIAKKRGTNIFIWRDNRRAPLAQWQSVCLVNRRPQVRPLHGAIPFCKKLQSLFFWIRVRTRSLGLENSYFNDFCHPFPATFFYEVHFSFSKKKFPSTNVAPLPLVPWCPTNLSKSFGADRNKKNLKPKVWFFLNKFSLIIFCSCALRTHICREIECVCGGRGTNKKCTFVYSPF